MKKAIKQVVGFLALCMTLLLLKAFILPKIDKAISSRNWQSIEGVVIKNYMQSGSGKNKKNTQLQFAYEYTIAGKKYIGNSRYYDFKEPSSNFQTRNLKKFIKQNPVNSLITVYYEPQDPTQATIVKGLLVQHYFLLFCNVFFILMSLHLLLYPHKWR